MELGWNQRVNLEWYLEGGRNEINNTIQWNLRWYGQLMISFCQYISLHTFGPLFFLGPMNLLHFLIPWMSYCSSLYTDAKIILPLQCLGDLTNNLVSGIWSSTSFTSFLTYLWNLALPEMVLLRYLRSFCLIFY